MLDRKIGLALPGEVVRLGKAWHGLVVLAASRKIADAIIKTAGGRTIPYPYPKSREGVSTQEYNSSGTPHLSVYMHPLASFAEEQPNGMDWSQYAIMQLYRLNGITIAGYSARKFEFFFTPDYDENGVGYNPAQSAAVPLSLDSRQGKLEAVIYEPLAHGEPHNFIGRKVFQGIDRISVLFHASQDGRRYFFYQLYAGNELSHDPLERQPVVSMVEMSGDLSDGINTIEATQTMIAGAPQDTVQEYYHDNAEYFDTSHESYVKVIDYREQETSSGVAAVCIDDHEEISYIMFNREMLKTADGSGTLSITEDSVFNAESNETRMSLSKFDLTHKGVTATIEARSTASSTSWRVFQPGRFPGDPPRIDDFGGDVNGTVTVKVDGVVVFSSAGSGLQVMGSYYRGRFAAAKTAVFSKSSAVGLYSVRAVSDRHFEYIEIYIYKTDWGSRDLTGMAVLVLKGRSTDEYHDFDVDPATIEQSLHFGKVFSKNGDALNEIVSYNEADFPDAIYRAYNPLTKEISGVYNTPIIYQ